MNSDAINADFASVSITIYTLVVLSTSLVIFTRVGNINTATVFTIVVGSIFPYFGFIWMYDLWPSQNPYMSYTLATLLSSPIFYLIIGVCLSIVLGIEVFYAFLRFWIYPTMREYSLVLRKKKLVHDERFFETGLIASIKSIYNPI